MRQQQQKSRNRNRGRKSSNPLSRNFESNGPDVKIRGNANHIAEKYSVLARDALTSGDTVMAENYFQHAEHYFRIIAANQQSNPQPAQNNSQRENGNGAINDQNDGADNDAADETSNDSGNQPQPEMASGEVKSEGRRNGRRPANSRRTSRASADKTPDTSTSPEAGDDVPVEKLSKDAALLPSSLIGKSTDSEGDGVPPTSEE